MSRQKFFFYRRIKNFNLSQHFSRFAKIYKHFKSEVSCVCCQVRISGHETFDFLYIYTRFQGPQIKLTIFYPEIFGLKLTIKVALGINVAKLIFPKGLSIQYVSSIFPIFDPVSSPCQQMLAFRDPQPKITLDFGYPPPLIFFFLN